MPEEQHQSELNETFKKLFGYVKNNLRNVAIGSAILLFGTPIVMSYVRDTYPMAYKGIVWTIVVAAVLFILTGVFFIVQMIKKEWDRVKTK